jgi:hypothetical protein
MRFSNFFSRRIGRYRWDEASLFSEAFVHQSSFLSQGSTKEDGPVTWHTNDLASEVTWVLNPLALDMEPVEYVGLGLVDLSQLQVSAPAIMYVTWEYHVSLLWFNSNSCA